MGILKIDHENRAREPTHREKCGSQRHGLSGDEYVGTLSISRYAIERRKGVMSILDL